VIAAGGAGHGVDGVSFIVRGWTVNEIPSTLDLLKPSDRGCMVRIEFKVAAAEPLPLAHALGASAAPALRRCPLTNLVGEDNRLRRKPGTPAVLRPRNHPVHEQDLDGCEISLSAEVTTAWLPCHQWRRAARAQGGVGPTRP